MDLVIPYRKETQHQGIELYYCIKSFRKFFDIRNVYVIGPKVPGSVNIGYAEGSHKQTNIIGKIKKACKTPEISDPFICISDDVFMLRSTELKYWHCGKLEGMGAMGMYKALYKNSIEKGCIFNFDNHAPIVYYKDLFLSRVQEGDYLIQSQYCIPEKGEFMPRILFNEPIKESDILKQIEGQIRFSTGREGVTPQMKAVWKKLYD